MAIKECVSKVIDQRDEISKKIDREKLKNYSWDEIIKNTIGVRSMTICITNIFSLSRIRRRRLKN